jgi:hypothetical protein
VKADASLIFWSHQNNSVFKTRHPLEMAKNPLPPLRFGGGDQQVGK